ncbi:MAG: transcriptional regulator [Gammaproteobacteria bacterium CG11_big_fil_rev_8_21_14_0_20_46_22]|nr:MAG: transcriptional regulator [Gammaproteobacteria bacterium CG12_big_fil_rev_8_21_14_0_65_46_12]PIR11059.1 MAG: transcriptional regulator [Gammaproteobacteria bacterium CG11_big_fil_rev_8_21_14_0_20_46_22]
MKHQILQNHPDKLQKIFAQNVRIERIKMNMTQEELADICGYHRTYIGSIERGERNVTLAAIEALAKAFKVKPYQLLVRDNEQN